MASYLNPYVPIRQAPYRPYTPNFGRTFDPIIRRADEQAAASAATANEATAATQNPAGFAIGDFLNMIFPSGTSARERYQAQQAAANPTSPLPNQPVLTGDKNTPRYKGMGSSAPNLMLQYLLSMGQRAKGQGLGVLGRPGMNRGYA